LPGSLHFPDQREEWSAENRDDPEKGGSGVRVFFLWEGEASAEPNIRQIAGYLRLGGSLALPGGTTAHVVLR